MKAIKGMSQETVRFSRILKIFVLQNLRNMSSLKFGQIAPNFNPIKLHAKTSPFQRKAWDTHFEEEEEFKALQRLKVETIESFNMALEMD